MKWCSGTDRSSMSRRRRAGKPHPPPPARPHRRARRYAQEDRSASVDAGQCGNGVAGDAREAQGAAAQPVGV